MNHWIKKYKSSFSPGDIIYWQRKYFNQTDWISCLIEFGSSPMKVITVYGTDFGDKRLEVEDCNGRLIMGVDPKLVEKVEKDFKATV